MWRRWFAFVTVGELFGFAVPAVTGVLVRDAAPVAAVVALLIAGGVEGSVLGLFQARVLRPVVPGFRSRTWVFATMLGALVAWSVGVVPVASSEGIGRWSPAVLWPAVVGGGLIVLLSIGVAQWLVLRRLIAGAGQWIWATALAWLAGLLAFTAFTSPLWQEGQSAVLMVLIGVLGGLLMAAVMAAVTGTFLVRILRAPMDSVQSRVG
ncbi:hypothetical protein DMB37_40025 [Nocardia sp. CS682]|nr:hypothetical protein DMB37_40025 [Nocardia sp. CS682]